MDAGFQLKQKKVKPPTFAELLFLLRTEQDQEAAKAVHMKQHLGSTKQKATTYVQFTHSDGRERGTVSALTSLMEKLAKQVADVQ